MNLILTADKKYLTIKSFDNNLEYEQLKLILNKKIKTYRFHPLVKKGLWDGNISFLKEDRKFAVGLWQYVKDNMNKNGFTVNIENLEETQDKIDYKEFLLFVDNLLKDMKIDKRDYQIDAAYNVLVNKRCTIQLATNSGKTLVSYIIFAYLINVKKIKNLVMIVPNVSLVIQTNNAFMEFNINNQVNMRIQMVYSGTEKNLGTNLTIGTFQSLVNLPKEYFHKYEGFIIDECHRASSKSIINITDKAIFANYKIGMSGTIPSDVTAEYLTVIAQTGPTVSVVRNDKLIEQGVSTPIKVTVVKMDYTDMSVKNDFYELSKRVDGGTLFNEEKKFVATSEKRLKFLTKLITSSTRNSLVLFHLIEHGKRLYEAVVKIKGADKVLYIDGKTKIETRELYKTIAKNNNDITMICSFGTFSTGIDVSNLFNLFLTESFKSDVVILQSIGRMLRKHVSKDYANIVDFVDDFSFTTEYNFKFVNYLIKHHKVRLKTYKDENFPVIIKEIKF